MRGLEQVKGDFWVAALGNLETSASCVWTTKSKPPSPKHSSTIALFLATGGERGRAQVDGELRPIDSGRPVGVITIEGIAKAELRARCVEVKYGVTGAKSRRAPIERETLQCGHVIGSAIIEVLKRFFQGTQRTARHAQSCSDFEEHFAGLCDLLRAFGDVASKPARWSEDLILCGTQNCSVQTKATTS